MRRANSSEGAQKGTSGAGAPRVRRRRVCLGLVAMAAGGAALMLYNSRAGDEPVSESEFKAALLVKLVRFVIWPDSSFAGSATPLEIGVLGKNPFGKYLDRLSTGKTLEDHPIKVRYATAPDDLLMCHFVFVCRERSATLKDIVRAFAGKSILLVGEEERFANEGGMINVVVKEQKPYLQINARVAEHAGLRFRGQLAQTRNIEWIERPSVESK